MKRRVLLILITFFMIVNCRVVTGLRSGHPVTLVDEYAVYTALLRSVYLGAGIQRLVIQSTTEVDKNMASSEELRYVQRQLKGVTQAMIDDLLNRSRQVLTLEQRFDLPVEVVLLTQPEIQVIFSQGGWDAFYKQYPQSQGTLVFSRVGFNPAVDQALVYAGNQSHYLAGAGYYYLLARENGAWTVKGQLMVWIS
jgi:hypothetical protein